MRKSLSPSIEESDAEQVDELVPDPKVAREFHTTLMGLWRWDNDPVLISRGWPPPVRIRNRKFRSRKGLEQFKATLMRQALEARGGAARKSA